MPASQVVSGAIIAVVLFAITAPPLRYSFRKKDPELVNLVTLALALKLLSSIARYFVAYQIYGGSADSAQYNDAGKPLASQFRHLDFHANVGKVVGTGFLKIVTGVVYAVTGVSLIGAFFIFAWFSFLGLWLCFRAFRIAFPEGNARTYALLLFFLPSMLFWPSALGKEGWMTLGLGLMAYGAARVLTRKPLGYTLTLLGAVETGVVRPHVTVLFFAAFFVAYLFRRDSTADSPRRHGKSAKFVGVVLLITLLVVGVTRAQSFFNNADVGGGGLTGTFTGTALRTSTGGSQFKPASFTSPQSIPLAVLSVTFRPFPWEAHNIQSQLAAAEGGFLLYLIWRNRRRLKNLPRWMIRRPYLLLCLVYSVLFAFAFSAVGNFGILDRERVQQLPFLLVLLALPDFRPGEGPDGTKTGEERRVDEQPRVTTLSRPVLANRPITDDSELRPRPPSRLAPAGGEGRPP